MIVTVVIPVCNAIDLALDCVRSVLEHTRDAAIVVVDDASTDPRAVELSTLGPRVEYRRSPVNSGYTLTCNRAIAACAGDVVLLNSDTRVTEGWLEALRACVDSDPRIATACPLSSDATIATVPCIDRVCRDLPSDETCAAAVRAARDDVHAVDAPTIVGYCQYIRREAWRDVGPFDALLSPRGYGEEVDWCLRARSRGWRIVICPDAYVWHKGGASFGVSTEAQATRADAARSVDARYPSYRRDVRAWSLLDPLRARRHAIRRGLVRDDLRVLQVSHTYGPRGGTELHVQDLHEHAPDDVSAAVVTARSTPEMRERLDVITLPFAPPVQDPVLGYSTETRGALVRRWWSDVLLGERPDVVHVQHLLGYGSLELPRMAKDAGARVIVSLHDHHLLCPRWTMDPPCVQYRCSDCDECRACVGRDVTDRAQSRADQVREILGLADAVVGVSAYVRDRFVRAYGSVAQKIRVIQYGSAPYTPAPWSPGPRVRAAFVGNMTSIKGADVLLRAIERTPGVAWSIIGGVAPQYRAVVDRLRKTHGVDVRGSYDRAQLVRELADIDAVLVPSIVAETYCATIDEALACGVPVIASAIGAMPERVRHGVNGLLVEPGDWRALQRAVLMLQCAPLLRSLRDHARPVTARSRADCREDYYRLWRGST
jgi:GT2 family glycosyltransferase/glycosyltransferase involved in cell wall biosynthesis